MFVKNIFNNFAISSLHVILVHLVLKSMQSYLWFCFDNYFIYRYILVFISVLLLSKNMNYSSNSYYRISNFVYLFIKSVYLSSFLYKIIKFIVVFIGICSVTYVKLFSNIYFG